MNALMELPSLQPQDAGPDRIRMIVDTEDVIRRAVQLRALKQGVVARRKVGYSEVVTAILREALAEEIAELLDDGGPQRRKRGAGDK
jgi:HEAT repeat protein